MRRRGGRAAPPRLTRLPAQLPCNKQPPPPPPPHPPHTEHTRTRTPALRCAAPCSQVGVVDEQQARALACICDSLGLDSRIATVPAGWVESWGEAWEDCIS